MNAERKRFWKFTLAPCTAIAVVFLGEYLLPEELFRIAFLLGSVAGIAVAIWASVTSPWPQQ
jgi:hypothetical protein